MINAEGRTIRSRAAKMGEKVEEGILWVSSLRFPINSPIKDVIYGKMEESLVGERSRAGG